jgi:alpha-L-fucosidase
MRLAGGAAVAGIMPQAAQAAGVVPSYLKDYAELYAKDPKAAALAWFREAKFGLFMHYGLYSILGRGEWVMYREAIPVAEYEKLKGQFRPDAFDADAITDLACEAGMRYVNITSRHHDSFCLFGSKHSDYTSVNSPTKRDLVGELAAQCQKKGLGLFLYYSYGLDWHHPYFYPRTFSPIARPDYKTPEPSYQFQKDEDFQHYIDFVHGQIAELLTNYGPLAGIWFDPIMTYYARPDLFPIRETYALVRRLQPQTLLCFKQGATGTEDFGAPERSGQSLAERVRKQFGEEKGKIAEAAWTANTGKHNEICDTLQPHQWGYNQKDDGAHLDADEVLRRMGYAFHQDCNLLMNTGPLPDGSLHPLDVKTLKEVGKRIRASGYPLPAVPPTPPAAPAKAKKTGAAAE